MKRSGMIRKILRWGSLSVFLLVGVAWLASTRWQVWYAWSLKILMSDDAQLLGIADGGVIYRSFHCIGYEEYIIGSPGWHWAWGSGDFGFHKRRIESGEFRYSAWIPMWPIVAGMSIPMLVTWVWPQKRIPGTCRTCGYDLTGNVSGQCSECGEPT